MEKQIFKVGDRVFDIRHGWGTIKKYDDNYSFPIEVKFDKKYISDLIQYTKYGKDYEIDDIGLLSFTEYGFDDRFSQERPINYKDYIGKWGKFWNDNLVNIFIDVLDNIYEEDDGSIKFISCEINSQYKNFEPLTEEQLKVLGLKNY